MATPTAVPAEISAVSMKWHPSSTTFPEDIYGPDTSATVSDVELNAIRRSIETHTFGTPLSWDAFTATPDWTGSDLDGILANGDIYDATQQRWNLGPDLEGRSLVDNIRWLLEQLCHLRGTNARFIVSRDLDTIPDLNAFNKSSPPLAICGASPATGLNTHPAPGYNCCIVPIEIRRQKDFDPSRALVLQLAIYARRCFSQQPERKTVYCFVLTEAMLYIWRFDINGYCASTGFNIHQSPEGFVRLILLLSQPDNPIILDPMFRDKGVRWMTIKNANNRNVVIEFQVENVVHINTLLCGRSTRCWKVKVPNTIHHFLVKRTWDLKEVGSESEAMLLASAKGLPYVAQVVAHSEVDVLGQAAAASCPRVHRVLVVEYYEGTIAHFRSKIELLYIIRDAVEGHRNLWSVGICHRDICPKNIRTKPCGNIPHTAGTQGVLVGLDRAKRVGRLAPTVPRARDAKDTNLFQSMLVLYAADKDLSIYPDYVDDLESFFYVLCLFCSTYRGRDDFNRMFDAWTCSDPQVSLAAKFTFCEQVIPANFVDPYFGRIFTDMLESMRARLHKLFTLRWKFSRNHVQRIPPGPTSVDEYRVFLAYINCAIAEMNAGPTSGRM